MSKKLLLADDSVTIQKVVNLTFADEGIEVITTADGDAAIQMIYQSMPDLVMADVNMPGLNGYQLCEKIKQHESLRHTPVILLVGSFEPFDEAEARRVGADDFLTKPFQSIRQLVNKVSDLLGTEDAYSDTRGSNEAETGSNGYELPTEPPSLRYGDAGMDDEMIEASSVSAGSVFDESAKFESKDYSEADEYDLAKTQPLSAEDLPEINDAEQEIREESYLSYEQETQNTSSEEISADNSEMQLQQHTTQQAVKIRDTENLLETPLPTITDIPEPDTASILEKEEEEDLLELPPLEDDDSEEAAAGFITPTRTETEQKTTVSSDESQVSESVGEIADKQLEQTSMQFPPDLIEAIAQRVIEKLSEQTIKEIAWEVVPQHADAIIKKMVEEKLKE